MAEHSRRRVTATGPLLFVRTESSAVLARRCRYSVVQQAGEIARTMRVLMPSWPAARRRDRQVPSQLQPVRLRTDAPPAEERHNLCVRNGAHGLTSRTATSSASYARRMHRTPCKSVVISSPTSAPAVLPSRSCAPSKALAAVATTEMASDNLPMISSISGLTGGALFARVLGRECASLSR